MLNRCRSQISVASVFSSRCLFQSPGFGYTPARHQYITFDVFSEALAHKVGHLNTTDYLSVLQMASPTGRNPVTLKLISRTWLFGSVVLSILLTGIPATAQEKGIGDFPKLSAHSDWPWWRGPTRNGFADDTPVPTKISETENVLWKVPVPGRGHSSPTVVGNQVYLTTADTERQIHSVLAFDRTSGKSLWQVEVSTGAFPEHNHAKNTEATPTVACDGERLFATFYHHDKVEAIALDLKGKILWRKDAGSFRPRRYEYGYAPSPLLYRNTVIVAAEYDGESFITALDRKTGDQVWKTPRPHSISFSTPVVTQIAGKDEMLISGNETVSAYNPVDGKPLWSVPGTTFATCGTMVWDKGIVFASGGYPKAETIAIKADGDHEVLWRNNQKCYEQSMLAVNGYLYALNDNGIIFCNRGSDGKEMWKQRLKGPVSASPVLANGHIYWANEMGTLYVFRPNPEKFDLVIENKIGTDSFPSPAICGGQIFLRVGDNSGNKRQEWLYCFDSTKQASR
jgi:outer membrane protein assembly factor BamB